jgi:hypothetical protein
MPKQARRARGGGLRGQDKQQTGLRGPHGGGNGPALEGGTPHRAVQDRRTPHENAQPGADVRSEPKVVPDVNLPEGLRRRRYGPYDRDRGRG